MPQDCQNYDAMAELPPITRARFAKGLQQRELAASAGMTRSYLSMLEIGRNKPSFVMAERLAKILDVEIAVLFPNGVSRMHICPKRRPAVPSVAEG